MPPSGNSSRRRSAYSMSEFNLGPYSLPFPSGTSMRSRGTETMLTVLPTGSSEATIMVSVRLVVREGLRSAPTSRIVSRSPLAGPTGAGASFDRVEASKTCANVSRNTVPYW